MLLWAAVGFVFVLGCVNIGGMLLARASGRIGEVATRLALGAPFSRIVRQLLIESTLLGLLGGFAGAFAGWGALAGLRTLGAMTFSFLESVTLDWRVLAATLVLTLIAGIAFGLAPAWQATRVDLRSAQSGSRGVAGRKRFISLGALVGGQVAITVPLLFGAGLFLHSFLHLWNLNPGFDPDHVLTAKFSILDARYQTAAQTTQFYEKVFARLRETPGIEAAAVAVSLPYERALNDGVKIPGQDRTVITNLSIRYAGILHGVSHPAAAGPCVFPIGFGGIGQGLHCQPGFREALLQEWRRAGPASERRYDRRHCGRCSRIARRMG